MAHQNYGRHIGGGGGYVGSSLAGVAGGGGGGPEDSEATAAAARVASLEERLARAATNERLGLPNPGPLPPLEVAGSQLVRTEKREDGVLRVYQRMEHAFPTGDRYVGETAGGKREGRGTYYFANGDVYVGEFRDNVFHGVGSLKRRSFKESGKQCTGRSYQGDFVGGVRDGRGRYATGFGDLYEGQFHNDKYHGKGAMAYANGDKYEGDWVEGQREGMGTQVYANKDVYEGQWRRGVYHGEGTLRYGKAGGSYAGSWDGGRMHGIGQRRYGSGAEYEGEYVAGLRCGKGVSKSAMGDLYVGAFREDQWHGEGTLIRCTGDRYQGSFARGAFAGVGRYEYERGGYYEGEYLAMHRCGVELCAPPRWFWDAWAFTPKTHIYDPVTGKLLTVRGVKVKDGEPVEKEEKDPKKYPIRKRLEQALAEMNQRRESRAAERATFERSIEYLSGEARERALERFAKKFNKQPQAFKPPILVGSAVDAAYLRAGGRADTAQVLAADGKRHGKGVRVFPDGSRYEGEWFQDLCHGFGVYVGGGPLGVRYEGEWKDGRRHGAGVESYGHTGNGRCICPLGGVHLGGARCFYDGAWEDGLYHGEGTFTCADGRQYHGAWSKGKRHGFGRYVMLPAAKQYSVARDLDGQILLQGVAEKGEFGQAVSFDDQFRIRVHEGYFNKNKRMVSGWGRAGSVGRASCAWHFYFKPPHPLKTLTPQGLGRETLNKGDVREGVFSYGRLNGIVRITFATGKVRVLPRLRRQCISCHASHPLQLTPLPPTPR